MSIVGVEPKFCGIICHEHRDLLWIGVGVHSVSMLNFIYDNGARLIA